jgi:hypothetical protein
MVTPDEDGLFVTGPLFPGRYWVMGIPSAESGWAGSSSVEVRAGLDVAVVRFHEARLVRGLVSDASGALAAAEVWAFAKDGALDYRLITLAGLAGQFHFPWAAVEGVAVVARDRHGNVGYGVVAAGTDPQFVPVTLTAGATLRLELPVGALGAVHVALAALDLADAPEVHRTALDPGEVEPLVLVPGRYRATVLDGPSRARRAWDFELAPYGAELVLY